MGAFFKILKRIYSICILISSILLVIATIRTILVESPKINQPCNVDEKDFIKDEGLSTRLARSLTFETISYVPREHRIEDLKNFANFLEKSFVQVHSSHFIKREVVNDLSLLYTVKGADSSLKPYMLAGHIDVVPVDINKWDLPPFSGKIENGFIVGRGAIDAKNVVLGILEALEFLLKNGFRPQRSIILAFGHDEEIGGYNGAAHINKLLLSRGIKLEYILDEGGFVLKNFIPGVKVPTAMLCVSEKGYANIKLEVKTLPGHSSAPPKETAIVILAKAVSKLTGDVFPSFLGTDLDYNFFTTLAPYASIPFRFVYANFWLFKSAISWVMERNHLTSCLIKTTTAVTKTSGGTKVNVLPSSASADVNFRIHPSQTVMEVYEYVRNIVNDDRVNITILESAPAHPISPFHDTAFGYTTIKNSIHEIYTEAAVVPATLMGNTDTKWYHNLTDAIYRFNPVHLLPSETQRFHGHNEKIAIDNYIQVVNFYAHLIKNSDQAKLVERHKHSEL